jgi:hypothetical protein
MSKEAGAVATEFILDVLNTGDLLFNGNQMRFVHGLQQDGMGSTNLGGGMIQLGVATAFTVTGGTVTGGGIIGGALNFSAGTITVGAGTTLVVQGNYTQGQNAVLRIQFNNAWGLLDVQGTANLNGTLLIDELGGNPGNNWQTVIRAGQEVAGSYAAPPPGWDLQLTTVPPNMQPTLVQVKKRP